MEKVHVYFMPGLAANNKIFERIQLPKDTFEMHFLEWILPLKKEDLTSYALRISKNITHKKPILIGVSFGGILVQELAKIIDVQKTIIISSVKSNTEFPRRMKVAKSTKLYKLIPTRLVKNIESLAKYAFGSNITHRLQLYDMYLSIRDKAYLDWAIENVINWNQSSFPDNTIHIHGDADDVFPIKYISNCIIVKGGTHIMILNKYRWMNENLPKIILND